MTIQDLAARSRDAVPRAANHDGDSDSTAAIAGRTLGRRTAPAPCGGALEVAITPERQKLRGGDATDNTVLGTCVFERRDGRWLLVHHHATRVPRQDSHFV